MKYSLSSELPTSRLGFAFVATSTLTESGPCTSFELVTCDLWGPAANQSSTGFTYFLTCVDAYSRFVWAYPLKLKSETLSHFIHFKTMVELQFNCKIKTVQTDGGWW
jgi:hypothetical protein